MKIRNGFVSNSSSSSFLILGKRISNPEDKIKEGSKVIAVGYGCGTSGDAQDFCMELDQKSYDILVNNKWFIENESDFNFFEAQASGYDEEKIHISKDMNCTIYIFQKDESSPENICQLKEFLKNAIE